MKLMLAQCAPRVGAVADNRDLALRCLRAAEERGCDLLVLPELAVTGYPPEDLLLRRDFRAASRAATAEIIAASGPCAILFGHPEEEDGRLYNSATLACRGEVVGRWRKRALPNYGVFDERRYFAAADATPLPISWRGIRLQAAICEEIWDDAVAADLAADRADLLVVLNASPFEIGKQQRREALLAERSRRLRRAICYVNAVGGQDELVFDGGSCLFDRTGRLRARAEPFVPQQLIVSLDRTATIAPLPEAEELLHRALVTGLRDYCRRNGCDRVVLGLSGGIDSALCAAIACDALGPDNVLGVLLPSRYTSDHAIRDAEAVARNLEMAWITLPIGHPVATVEEALAPLWRRWGYGGPDVTEENIQARMRALLLMAIANKTGRMLLSTSNKSESAVGYTTLYGDMAGAFAPLKDLYKQQVYALARHLNRARKRIPASTLTKPPSAELRPDQRDSDSLPEYDRLDPILQRLIEQDEDATAIASSGFDREDSELAERLLHAAEHKRRQAPPGIKVSARAFGRDRRYPITHQWRATARKEESHEED
ncbi:MAG: NAD+ synthase [Zetaproteobacteria bacterium]|nr:MAG: NAD+ synthase [Zetaproteobacteria bacterium]